MRLFIAVDLDPAVLRRVQVLVTEHRALAPRARWQAFDNLHVTLSFLGEVPADRAGELGAAIAAVALRSQPFPLCVRSAGGFPDGARPRVLWLGIGGDTRALGDLKMEIDGAIESLVPSEDRRDFHPHLTLARSARRGGDRELGACVAALRDVELDPSTIREVVLYQSQPSPGGVRYTPLLRAPLGPTTPE